MLCCQDSPFAIRYDLTVSTHLFFGLLLLNDVASLFHANVIAHNIIVSLMSLYFSVGVEDEPRIHDFEMIRSVSLNRWPITMLLLGPFPYFMVRIRIVFI